MTETINLSLSEFEAQKLLEALDKLTPLYVAPTFAPLADMSVKIKQGQIALEEKSIFNVIMCPVAVTAKMHDCWILHKPSKTIYYAPFGHHYQLIEYLWTYHPGVIDNNWNKHSTKTPTTRTGDVKNGHPRTAKESPVVHKTLRPALIKAYYAARGQIVPEGVT